MLLGSKNLALSQLSRVPSVSGRGAVRDPQEARGSSQDLPPKGHSDPLVYVAVTVAVVIGCGAGCLTSHTCRSRLSGN
jgi:hypothetical protein